ncbi:MAG: prepilin peptidase [Fidelibacterota bacterium]
MTWILVVAVGLAVGSFLTVVIHRLPAGESVISPSSHCPSCHHPLKVWENLPVVSYLVLRGRCSHCRARISLRYPLVEVLTAGIFALTYSRFGFTLEGAAYAAFLSVVMAITFIDIDHQIIPNGLLIGGLVPGVFLLFVREYGGFQPYLYGAVGMGVGFFLIGTIGGRVFKRDSLGMGDVKYAALIGLVLGWRAALVASAVTFFSGALFFVVLMLMGRARFGMRVPLGPFMSLGTVIALFWGSDILWWYLRFLRLAT